MTTHYLAPFVVSRRQLQRAVCGVFIDAAHHSNDATCPDCRAWLEKSAVEDEQTALAIEDEFPEFDGRRGGFR